MGNDKNPGQGLYTRVDKLLPLPFVTETGE